GIISKSQSNPNQGWSLTCGDNGRVRFQLSDQGGWKGVESPRMLLNNRWYHVAGVFDGSKMKLYINGEMVSETYATLINASSAPLVIGNGFEGVIDEARIWNVARTSSDILTTMTSSLTGSEPGLVAYYKFNEGLGSTTAGDGTPNLHTASLSGNFNLVTAWVSGFSVTAMDAAVAGLVAPNSLTAFDGETRVKIRIKNTGTVPVSNFPVSYTVGNGSPFMDTVLSVIQPNQTYEHNFKNIEDFSALSSVTIKGNIYMAGDADSRNDS